MQSGEIVQLDTPSVHGAFYDRQFKQYLKEEQAKNPITAADVRHAREKMFDAREQLARVQSGESTSVYSLQELREKAADAEKHYQEVYARGGHLEHAERAQKFDAEREARREYDEKKRQAAHAKEQEAEAKAETRTRYLAAGGTAEQFERAWPAMWEQELARRVQANQDTFEARIRASGQYHRI